MPKNTALMRHFVVSDLVPVGVEVSIFGDRIVLLEASGVVVDILEGILR